MQVATSTIIGNSENYGQPDHGDATNGTNDTNGNAMQFGARLGTVTPNLLINNVSCNNANCDNASCDNTNYIIAMQFGARWGIEIPNLFIEYASSDDANCGDVNNDA